MHILNRGLAASILALALALPAQAEVTATVTLASDYLFDGISQTQGDPTLQGSIDYSHESGFYAGIWSSNYNTPNTPDIQAEVDYYLGYASDLNEDFSYDMGWARYTYPGRSGTSSADYNEVYLGLYHKGGTGLKFWRSGDYFGLGTSSFIREISHDMDIGKGYTLHLEYDVTQVEQNSTGALYSGNNAGEDRYSHYAIGFQKSAGGLDWEVSYHNTSEDGAADDVAQPTWLLSVSKTFTLVE